ncbi:MAG TPA: hypothetical protein VG015_05865 [Candidatus Dormibacteraeota bacterium]|nr:hypothetical protein [Candidatus Dormibacteraeota bacterium]
MAGLGTSDLEQLKAKADFFRREKETASGATAAQQSRMGEIVESIDGLLARQFMWMPDLSLDAIWANLDELRAIFCQVLPVASVLGWLIKDIEGDFDHLTAPDMKSAQAEIATLRTGFQALLHGTKAAPNEAQLRAGLQNLAYATGQAREGLWVRVNLKRSRLELMGALLAIGLVVATLGLAIGSDQPGLLFPLLALFGALGGLVSSLLSSDPVFSTAVDFYINYILLKLRPLVGATLGLASYFALQAGVFTAVNITKDSSLDGFLIVAFAAGFSERMFVNKVLVPIAGGGQSKAAAAQSAA